MSERKCPRCGNQMHPDSGDFALLSGKDVPRFGSKAEVMVTPREILRVRACVCKNESCKFVEFYAS